jgi:Domain of unknown function (DUF4402)
MQGDVWLDNSPLIGNALMSTRLNRLSRQIAVASGIALTGLSSAFAQQSSTATANATATVIQPIAISTTSGLVFGNLAVGATGGTVAIGVNDAVTIAGASHTITQPAGNNGSPLAAVFAVTGAANFTYAITLPANSTVTISSGGNSMAVNDFVSNPAATGSGTLSGAGAQTLKVGATLTVGNNQAAGSYTGTFDVTVAYN